EREASLLKQYKALLLTEGVTLEFSEDGIDALADIEAEINAAIENIEASRLQTVIERVLDGVNYWANHRGGEMVRNEKAFLEQNIGDLARNTDLSKFNL